MDLSLQNYFENFLGLRRASPVSEMKVPQQDAGNHAWKGPHVIEAWRRCREKHGLGPGMALFRPVSDQGSVAALAMVSARSNENYGSLASSQEERERSALIELADVMAAALGDCGVAIMVSDTEGVLFHIRNAGLEAGASLFLRAGPLWAESLVGNNGIGTAALLRQPVAFQGEEHYCSDLHGFGTVGCPILAPDGRVLAILGIITDRLAATGPLLAFVRLAGHVVEARMFEALTVEGWIIRLRPAEPVSETVAEATLFDAVVVADETGCIRAASHSALALLCHSPDEKLPGAPLEEVLGVGLYRLLGMVGESSGIVRLVAPNGRSILVDSVAVSSARNGKDAVSDGVKSIPPSRADSIAAEPRRVVAGKPDTPVVAGVTGLTEPAGDGDAIIGPMLPKLLQMQERKIAMLITGESGVGKNYLVQTLHELGPRKDKPLVTINTAGIPRELIQSELFGYRSGSFTGAHSKGSSGKVLAAEGGVLFLNEIGDMPFELQASLLHLLESSEVIPIGGTRPINVDIHVVAATNRSLQEQVLKGTFRQDLYYRLNGVQVWLPPLRERPDKEQVILKVFNAERESFGDPEERRLSPDVMRIFLQHPWPGNIREVRNVVRLILASASGPVIHVASLPRGFLEEMDRAALLSRGQAPGEWSAPRRAGSSAVNGTASLTQWEQRAVRSALDESGGNITKAARILGVTRTTLYRKMVQYGFDAASVRPAARNDSSARVNS